jgi:phospholipid-transporting ATPase
MVHYKRKVSLNVENVLLRGSSLKNTEWIVGFVIYAGHQTKIMMNSANSRFKMSTIEKGTNKQIILIFIVQLIMCLTSAIIGTSLQDHTKLTYLELDNGKDSDWNTNWFLMILK